MSSPKEAVRCYNKSYYEKNRESILKKAQEKEACPTCGRMVSHENLRTHQKSKHCTKISNQLNLAHLDDEVKRLTELINIISARNAPPDADGPKK